MAQQYDIYVPGRGPLDAGLVILGESPGREEVKQSRPFCGPSGKKLDEWLHDAGIDSQHVRFENVYPFLPPQGSIMHVPEEQLKVWQDDCLVRMDQCQEAVLYVPVGNIALRCLTGKWGITKWRGSILSFYRQSTNSYVKVIPTIHPASILYQSRQLAQSKAGAGEGGMLSWEKRCRLDWQRIAQEMQFDEMRLPERDLVCDPEEWVIENLIEYVYSHPETKLSIDIETIPDERRITCIAFCVVSIQAFSLAWNKRNYEQIKALCESPNPKVLQNGLYDAWWLWHEGIKLRNYIHDTRAKMHFFDQTDNGSLAYQASIMTREPYYKPDDEAKEKFWTGASWYELLEYNAKDSAVTLEIDEAHDANFMPGQWEQYCAWYPMLFNKLLKVMLHGVRIDKEAAQAAFVVAMEKAREARDRACSLAERPLFKLTTKRDQAVYAQLQADYGTLITPVKKTENKYYSDEEIEKSLNTIEAKGISDQELSKVLKAHGVPIPRSTTNKSGETLDEVALRRLKQRYSSSKPLVAALLDQVLIYREQKKLSESFQLGDVDADGRMRCEYSYVTRTNRLASKKNPYKSGSNLQNRHRDSHHIFVPDEGCIFVKCDLSRAENRLVQLLSYRATGSEKMLFRARAMPGEYDGYRELAALIFDVPYDQVNSYPQRFLGKKLELAFGYGLGPFRFANELLKEGIEISVAEAKRWFAIKEHADPEILEWQKQTRQEILQHRSLTNSWGRVISWPYKRFDDELYREAYAWRPQSDVGMLNNLAGFIPLMDFIELHELGSRVNLLVHDEIVVSCPPHEAWQVASFLVEYLGASRRYYGVDLAIPVQVHLGRSWKTEHEFSVLPSREQFEQIVESLREKGESNGRE